MTLSLPPLPLQPPTVTVVILCLTISLAALDAAICAANHLGAPLLVLIHISEDRQPHSTARRMHFLLEGVRSMQAQLRKRNITAAFHLTRAGHRQPAHLSLAHRAALVVTEEPFCAPYLQGLAKLCASKITAPVPLCLSHSQAALTCLFLMLPLCLSYKLFLSVSVSRKLPVCLFSMLLILSLLLFLCRAREGKRPE